MQYIRLMVAMFIAVVGGFLSVQARADSAYIAVDSATVFPGDTVRLAVRIQSSPVADSARLLLSFSSLRLQPIAVQGKDGFLCSSPKFSTMLHKSEQGALDYGILDVSCNTVAAVDSGILLYVDFIVLRGSSAIASVEAVGWEVNGVSAPFLARAGIVFIEDVPVRQVFGDGLGNPYPNPFNLSVQQFVAVPYVVGARTVVTVALYTLDGKLQLEQTAPAAEKGNHVLLLDVNRDVIPSGSYLMRMITDKGSVFSTLLTVTK